MGVPGETLKDYYETIGVVRELKPDDVQLSIFYPYVGTDLYDISLERGLIPDNGLETSNERHRATLDLPDFPKWRIQLEFILFWYKAYKGIWPMDRIFVKMARAFILRFTRLAGLARYLIIRNKLFAYIFRVYLSGPKKVTGIKEEPIGGLTAYHTGEL